MAGSEAATELRSQRLSKPRTKSSRDLLKHVERNRDSCSPKPTADTYVFDDQTTIVNSHSGDRRSRRTSRSRIREFLSVVVPRKYQSGISFEDEGLKEWREIRRGSNVPHSEIGLGSQVELISSPLASSIQLSHHSNSMLYLPNENSSSNHVSTHSNSRLLLSCEDNIPESTRIAMQIMEKAHTDSIAAQNHISPSVDEDMHVDSVMSPIRRRSLYTPGIATRTPNDILRKLPPPKRALSKEDRDYYYNPNLSESSPLGRLAAMDIGNHGRSTPASLEYSHLGGLKPGTLRVMNGTTSPVPLEINPLRMHPLNPELVDHVGRFMDLEGIPNHDQLPHSPGNHLPSTCDLVISNSPLQADQEPEKGHWSQWRDNDLKPDAQSKEMNFNDEHKSDDGFAKQSTPSNAPSISSDKMVTPNHKSTYSNLKDHAFSIAQSYIQELPTSPYADGGSSSQSSITLDHVSHTGLASYSSFDDEGIVMSKSPQPIMDIWRSFIDDAENRRDQDEGREDALRKLTANAASESETITRTEPTFAISTNVHLSSDGMETIAAKTTYTSDSGYGSSDSLKSFVASALGDGARSVNAASSFVSLPTTFRCDPISQTMLWPAQRTAEIGAAQPSAIQDHLSAPPTTGRGFKMAEHAPAATLENLNESSATLQSASASSSRRFVTIRKLQKQRPFSQQSPAHSLFVQSVRKLSHSTIPPVPSEVAARHSERLREFPLLEHTFPSPQDVKRYDSSPTEESIAVPIRFPSPTNTPERRNSIISSNLDWPTSKSKKSKSIKRATYATTSKAQRRKSLGESPAALTNFGTENMGDNPYDIARSATGSRNEKLSNVSHPVEMDGLKPRPKSVIGMGKEAVVEVARSHSRQKSQSKNYVAYSTKLKDSGGVPANLTRRRSMFADAPPVPALPEEVPPMPAMPTKQQVAHWQAQISTSTPAESNALPRSLQINRSTENLKPPTRTRGVAVEQYEKKVNALEEWHSMRLGGDQRRKSAGDALIARFQALRISNTFPSTEYRPIHSKKYIAYSNSFSLDVQGLAAPIDKTPPQPSRQPPPLPSQEASFSTLQSAAHSGRGVAAATATF
ncbi:hypothetical protein MMC31_005762 [Peltigera leucophlebia]|nr:hypothetical protein [Peltigera leucophlebia]